MHQSDGTSKLKIGNKKNQERKVDLFINHMAAADLAWQDMAWLEINKPLITVFWMSHCKHKITLLHACLMQGGEEVKPNQERRTKGRHNPQTRNFQKLPHDRWYWYKGTGSTQPWKPVLVQQSSRGAIPSAPQCSPWPEPPTTLGVPQISGSLASSGPLPKYQTLLTSLPSDVHVKEDSRITGVGGLSLRGRVRHIELQLGLGANSENLVGAQQLTPKATFSAKICPRRWRATSGVKPGSRALTSGASSWRRFRALGVVRVFRSFLSCCLSLFLGRSCSPDRFYRFRTCFIAFPAVVAEKSFADHCLRPASGPPRTDVWLLLWNLFCLSGKWE